MSDFKKLSIVIPTYNEARTLKQLLAKVAQVELIGNLQKEIIIIDDGSTDNTQKILKNLEDQYKIIYHPQNLGKGAALRQGFLISSGDIVLIQDADLEYDPQEYNNLLKPILAGQADVVYGSRLMTNQPHRVLLYWHYLGNRIITTLSNMFTNINLSDMETCYKIMTRPVIDKIAHRLKSKDFGIEPEITARVAQHQFRIYEIGISYYGRSYVEGKKIKWWDGLKAIFYIIIYNIFDR